MILYNLLVFCYEKPKKFLKNFTKFHKNAGFL